MRLRWLNFISQFTTDIQYVQGSVNQVADALSRVEELSLDEDWSHLADHQEQDQELPKLLPQDNLHFKKFQLPGLDRPIWCEMTTSTARPYLPPAFRRSTFDKIHNLSHPGVRASRRMLASKYFWPSLNADVGTWAKACLACQKAKVTRHTIAPPAAFSGCGRFEHVHLDLFGPLPPSKGMRYCLTMVDRFTRWPEAVPLPDIAADTVATAFLSSWIARFGTPRRVTTDQGRQFESSLFCSLRNLLGIERARTTAYHPQTNGVLERWHRAMKSALTAQMDSEHWVEKLPLVLLGLRTTIREDIHASVAEAVYGLPLRLPGEFLVAASSPTNPTEHLQQLREHLAQLRPAPFGSSARTPFVHKALSTCTHVLLRDDTVRKPLQPPYTGPHPVISRGDKVYKIRMPDKSDINVSIDRLKPVFQLADTSDSVSAPQSTSPQTPHQTATPQPTSAPPTPAQQQHHFRTRSGRTVKPSVRFRDYVTGGE